MERIIFSLFELLIGSNTHSFNILNLSGANIVRISAQISPHRMQKSSTKNVLGRFRVTIPTLFRCNKTPHLSRLNVPITNYTCDKLYFTIKSMKYLNVLLFLFGLGLNNPLFSAFQIMNCELLVWHRDKNFIIFCFISIQWLSLGKIRDIEK